VLLGPPPSAQSYLDISRVIDAAKSCVADALHPGYGFLSENAAIARACTENNIVFIGPTEAQLRAIGDKLLARDNAEAAGLPIVPGGPVKKASDALQLAETLGWPILLKAVGGGGGRGMKIVHAAAELTQAMDLAMAEADNAFGDKRIYLERYVARGRHVEVQILGDGSNVIHHGTRDCSIQRRYQKLVEEAPAPGLSNLLRDSMENAAVRFGRHLAYQGLGTVEFLLDGEREEFYFLEMNARIQVEHPVTEAITGIDLVAQQIRIAEGRPLGLKQNDVQFNGHAIECRLNAEDCMHDFRPSPGEIRKALFPAGIGIRVDTHIESGSVVPPYYDSLLGKLIVTGENREAAIKDMQQALGNCHIEGIANNLILHKHIMQSADFMSGGVDTGFIELMLKTNPLERRPEPDGKQHA
jgi:acetyl-CoA carboxylase biotin carboxylase subunit